MRTIYRYLLEPNYSGRDMLRLRLPGHPRMLYVRVVDNKPYLYCLLDTSLPELIHEFHLAGTGEEVPGDVGNYVDTFEVKVTKKTSFTGHLFIRYREMARDKEDERA